MPVVQSSYETRIDNAKEGHIDNMETSVLISRTVETAAGIGFGKPVTQGSNDKGVIATGGSTTSVLGITMRDRSVRTADKISQYEDAVIMTKGVIWVTAAVAVDAGDPVHVIVASNTFSKTGGVTLSNARWDTSASANALAKVRLG